MLESALDLDPGAHGALGVVFGDLGDAERGHHPVAHELGDGPAVRVDRVLEQRVIAGQHLTRDLRVGALTEAGGAAEVGEEHRDRLANRAAIGKRSGRGRGCCRCDRGLVGNRGAALIAEPQRCVELGLAVGAALREWRPAPAAEAGAGAVHRAAQATFHRRPTPVSLPRSVPAWLASVSGGGGDGVRLVAHRSRPSPPATSVRSSAPSSKPREGKDRHGASCCAVLVSGSHTSCYLRFYLRNVVRREETTAFGRSRKSWSRISRETC